MRKDGVEYQPTSDLVVMARPVFVLDGSTIIDAFWRGVFKSGAADFADRAAALMFVVGSKISGLPHATPQRSIPRAG